MAIQQMPSANGDLQWLLRTMNAMLRCRTVPALLDLAYEAVREGLGYDRVGLWLLDQSGRGLVSHIGTDEDGRKYYPQGHMLLLSSGSFYTELLGDPRMLADGPGFVYLEDAINELPTDLHAELDGRPGQTLLASLRARDRVLGLISVDNLLTSRVFGPADAPPLVAFANALAVALENSMLLESWSNQIENLDAGLSRRVAELEWLRDISRQVNAATTLDRVMDIVYNGIQSGLGYDRVGLHVVDYASGQFVELRGTDDQGRKLVAPGRVLSSAPDSPAWQIPSNAALLRGADYYLTDDLTRDTPPMLLYLLDGAPKENLTVALRNGQTLIGLISVDNLLSGRPISREAVGPLLALANHVGIAVENVRLLERERAERARLEVLLESARILNSSLDSGQILRELAPRLGSALSASSVSFTQHLGGVLGFKSLAYHLTFGSGPLISVQDAEVPEEHAATLEQVIRSRQPYSGYVDDPGLSESECRYLRGLGLSGELLIPVVVHGEATGVLEVRWDHRVAISAEIVTFCTTIAEQAGVALGNAFLYADAAARAECDALTGLLNHRALVERLEVAVAAGMPCMLLLLDIDAFKHFNDTYGHLVGDAMLIQVAGALREACREGDVAGRYGGDEFALILYGASDSAAFARRLERAVRSRYHLLPDGTRIPLAVSIGIAAFPGDGETRQQLIAVADRAMYAAKRGEGAVARRRALHDLLETDSYDIVEGLLDTLAIRDRYWRERAEHVTGLALLLAERLDLSAAQRRVLATAAPLLDAGMLAVPERLLLTLDRHTSDRDVQMQRHIADGVAIIRSLLHDEEVAAAVACHHERWDGLGYPHGLRELAIPLLGRVLQLVDAVATILLERPQRPDLQWNQVVAELRAGAGSRFDPDLVEPFIAATLHLREAPAS